MLHREPVRGVCPELRSRHGQCGKETHDTGMKLVFQLFSIPTIITANYYADKILNGSEFYHSKIDPYVKKTCLAVGGAKTLLLSLLLIKGLAYAFVNI